MTRLYLLWPLVPSAAFIAILILDEIAQSRRFSLPVTGLLDEPAHALTALIILLAVPAASLGGIWLWALLGSVIIDLDHMVLYLVWSGFSVDGGRPPTHSLLVVAALLAGAALTKWRTPLLGLAVGVLLHLSRDIAASPGVPLFWPLVPRNFILPYPLYVGGLLLATAAGTVVVLRRRAAAGIAI